MNITYEQVDDIIDRKLAANEIKRLKLESLERIARDVNIFCFMLGILFTILIIVIFKALAGVI
jgi:hypothetical protein